MSRIVTITLNPAIDVYTTVERIAPAVKMRCDAERRDPGGGGVNVARVVRRLGGDALAIYAAGGSIGAQLGQLILGEGVRAIETLINGETRESFRGKLKRSEHGVEHLGGASRSPQEVNTLALGSFRREDRPGCSGPVLFCPHRPARA